MSANSNLSSGVRPTRDQVLGDVKQIVGEHMGIAPDDIREGDHLVNDLGCDSLDVTEIAMELEEHFAIDVPDEFIDQSLTVGAIADGVVDLLAAAAESTVDAGS